MNKETKNKLLTYIADKFAWLFIMFLGKTAFISLHNRKYVKYSYSTDRPIMFVVWHGHMLLPIYVHRHEKVIAMVSEHTDGEMIARTVERLGFLTVRGSSTRGGSKAYRAMLRALKSGKHCTILPDGPNGPRHEFKMGAVQLAQRANAIIQPLTFGAQKSITLKTWDRFTMWKPFSRIALVYGKPISLPRKTTPEQLEDWRQKVENRLNNLQVEADALFSA